MPSPDYPRKAALTSACFVASSVLFAPPVYASEIDTIEVIGAHRVSAQYIEANLTISKNKPFSDDDLDESVKKLYALGQFDEVTVNVDHRRLLITVVENKVVNQVVFNGNRKIKDDKLTPVVKTKASGAYTREQLNADVEAIKAAYAAAGRDDVQVSVQVVPLSGDFVNVAFVINEGERTKIAAIEFTGNEAYSSSRLATVIKTKKSNFLSFLTRQDVYGEEKMASDKAALRKFYVDKGYADFEIKGAHADFDPATKQYKLGFSLSEGPRYRFGPLTLSSTVHGLKETGALQKIGMSEGDVYSEQKVAAATEKLTELAAGEGYPFARVRPRAKHDFAGRQIGIEFLIDEGERAYIEKIVIRGNSRTRDYVIRREFDVSEGDPYNQQLLDKSKRRLEALGYFKSVTISTAPGSAPDRVILNVDVEDDSTGSFGIGAGASSSGPVLEASVEEKNFLGRGQYIKLAASGGWDDDDDRSYSLAFTEPYFLGYHLAAGFDLNYAQSSYDDYDVDQAGATFRITAPITDELASTFRYSLTRLNYSGSSDDLSATYAAMVDGGPWIKSAISNTMTFNSLDDVKHPHGGVYATLTQELAGLGGDSEYYKISGKLRYYQTLNDDADLVGSLTVGGGQMFTLGDSVHTFDQFTLGGNEVRGFAKNGIGPRISGVDDQTLGGTTYFYASTEVSFPLPAVSRDFGLRAAFFADAGTLLNNKVDVLGSDVSGGDGGSIRSSVGVGLIWDSPFGALRVDYAVPITYEDTDDLERFKIGINSSF